MTSSENWFSDFQQWFAALPVKPLGIAVDSRRVKREGKYLFAAVRGHRVDGRAYIAQALANGAVGVITEASVEGKNDAALKGHLSALPFFGVERLNEKLSAIADWIYQSPSSKLKVIGVTGTNGKTSSTHWLMQALTSVGLKTAVIGTLGNGFQNELDGTLNTTPDGAQVQEAIARYASEGARAVAMEVSSIGLAEHRVDAVRFETAVLTNITRDHLDYHQTMDAYIAAKEKLFSMPGLKNAVLNFDDPVCERFALDAKQAGAKVLRYSIKPDAKVELKASAIELSPHSLKFEMEYRDGDRVEKAKVDNPNLTGAFNVSNLLGVAGTLLFAPGATLEKIAEALSKVTPPPGRMERFGTLRTPTIVVDYAHTPDALENVCGALRKSLGKKQRLIGVFGCGGDRDAGKRTLMGEIAGRLMDRIIVTNDNPRSEKPETIASMIVAGIAVAPGANYKIELDRRRAIVEAVSDAKCGDVVLVAGKGHETYQEVKGSRSHFSDREVCAEALKEWDASRSMRWKLSEIAAAIGGQMLGADRTVDRVVHDSRNAVAGDLYVAIKGARVDGHDYVEALLKQGVAALVDAQHAPMFQNQPVIAVNDTVVALGAMAKAWRRRLNTKLAVVAGSNGKTTTKAMIAHLLDAYYGERFVFSREGNFNNAIGMPLTVLGLRPSHKVGVVELGMNHRGETAELAPIAAPDCAVITNAQREHQEFMKDVKTVAEEHADLLSACKSGGHAVLNVDDQYFLYWSDCAKQRKLDVISFGSKSLGDESMVGRWETTGAGIEMDVTLKVKSKKKTVSLTAPVFGDAMARDALAAMAVCHALGVPLDAMAKAMPDYVAVRGRLNRRALRGGMVLIDDSYNANPDSARAAIDVLSLQPPERWLVLGDMGEVGSHGVEFHEEIGAYAKEKKIDRLFALGAMSVHAVKAFGEGGSHFENRDALAEALTAAIAQRAPGSLLIKGSRFMGMEKIVEAVERQG